MIKWALRWVDNFTVSEQGFGNTISYAFSKGAFLGMSVEGAVIGARHKVNQTFLQSYIDYSR
jgi:lipid-binding SYLF domain-containing protein